MASHKVWKSGLGVASNVAALDPRLVLPVDHVVASKNLEEPFGYDDKIAENPDPAPRLFRSCQELHPGVCSEDPMFSRVQNLVLQFKTYIEINKISPPVLLRVDTELCSSSSSSYSPPRTLNWYMLGSIRKRPVCHMLAKYVQYEGLRSVLLPEIVDKGFFMTTCHSLFLHALKWAEEQTDRWNEMQVNFLVQKHKLIGCEGPGRNRIELTEADEDEVSFSVGPLLKIPVLPKKPRSAPVPLRFGLKVAQKPRMRKPKRKRVELEDEDGGLDMMEEDLEAAEGGDEIFNEDQDHGEGEEQEEEDLNRYDAFAAKLSLQQFKELKKAVASLATRATEFPQDDFEVHLSEDDDGNQSRRRQRPSRSGSDIPLVGQSETADPGVQSLNFSHRKGILELIPVKKALACLVCNQRLMKGEMRFVVSLKENRPSRSVHPHCVAGMDPSLFESSIEWLENYLKSAGNIDEFNKSLCRDSLQRLTCMRAAV